MAMRAASSWTDLAACLDEPATNEPSRSPSVTSSEGSLLRVDTSAAAATPGADAASAAPPLAKPAAAAAADDHGDGDGDGDEDEDDEDASALASPTDEDDDDGGDQGGGGPVLTGRVVRRTDPGYPDARIEYNSAFSIFPKVVVFCESTRDVSNAVRWAVANRVPLRARCGRHSYEAYSSVDHGVVIDVSELDKIRVSPDRTTAVIGAGADLQDVYAKLFQVGVTIPGGSCPSVGIAGLTLGGGFGLLGRYAGLTCDRLRSVRMVTATGAVVDASATEHPDLFWALRGGGGGNFGIVTSFTFAVVPIGNVAVYQVNWAWEHLPAVVRAWQAWAPATDSRLTSVLGLPARAQGVIRSAGQFVGSLPELQRLVQPLLAAAPVTNVQFQAMSYIDAVNLFAGTEPGMETWAVHWHSDHTSFKNTSAYAYRPFGDAAIATIVAALEQAPSADNLVQFDAYGGAVAAVPPRATAFFHRRPLFNLQYQAYWTSPSDAERNERWVEAFRRSMLPYTRGGYINYIDRNVVRWERYYYGGNVARLRRVKRAWDPNNVFSFPQSIPPARLAAEADVDAEADADEDAEEEEEVSVDGDDEASVSADGDHGA